MYVKYCKIIESLNFLYSSYWSQEHKYYINVIEEKCSQLYCFSVLHIASLISFETNKSLTFSIKSVKPDTAWFISSFHHLIIGSRLLK